MLFCMLLENRSILVAVVNAHEMAHIFFQNNDFLNVERLRIRIFGFFREFIRIFRKLKKFV